MGKLPVFFVGKNFLLAKIILLIICSITIECCFLRINVQNLFFLAGYSGGDDFLGALLVQNIIDTGWGWYNGRVGVPGYMNYLAFPSESLLRNFDMLLFKVISSMGFNAFHTAGITLLLEPLICVITAFFAIRAVAQEDWLSGLGALTFAFLPFYWQRFIAHMSLTMYMFVPLAFLMCIWLCKGEIFNSFSREELHNKKNWLSVLFCVLIANNGIAYWQAFSCFFLFVAAFQFREEMFSWKKLLARLIPVVIITLCFSVEFIPMIIDKFIYGNVFNMPKRVAVEPEIFGLKIVQMIVPQQLPGHTGYERSLQTYFQNAPLSNENNTAYLGLVGAIGFLLLIARLFYDDVKSKMFSFFSKLNLAGVLLATIGGFSTIGTLLAFGYEGTFLRGYNRISVFIGFIGITAFCLLAQRVIDSKTSFGNRWRFGIAVFMIIGIGFQSWVALGGHRGHWGEGVEAYESDRAFVTAIENLLPEGAAVYQMPYHPFPEAGPVKKMNDYQHLAGVLHSKKLRWSYGAIRGSDTDNWMKDLSQKDIDSQVEIIRETGFAGIYLDRRAYDEAELKTLEGSLKQLVDENPLVSQDKNLVFFKFS